jgi:hypothetical protein
MLFVSNNSRIESIPKESQCNTSHPQSIFNSLFFRACMKAAASYIDCMLGKAASQSTATAMKHKVIFPWTVYFRIKTGFRFLSRSWTGTAVLAIPLGARSGRQFSPTLISSSSRHCPPTVIGSRRRTSSNNGNSSNSSCLFFIYEFILFDKLLLSVCVAETNYLKKKTKKQFKRTSHGEERRVAVKVGRSNQASVAVQHQVPISLSEGDLIAECFQCRNVGGVL